MKNRIIDNYATSILGLVIFGVAIYLLATTKVDVVGFSSLITLGLTLLRAKDSLIGLEAK